MYTFHLQDQYEAPNHITRALILSISVCYRARLHNREDFDDHVSLCFVSPLSKIDGANQFYSEIKWYVISLVYAYLFYWLLLHVYNLEF